MKTTLSLFYLLFYAFVSIPFALYPLHLEVLGFTPVEIGTVAAVTNLAIMVGAITSLQIVARLRGRLPTVLRVCALLSLLFFAPLLLVTGFWGTVLLIFLSSFFFKGAGSLVDALTVRASFQQLLRFEHVRVWGSFGFIACLWMVGPLVDLYGTWMAVLSGVLILALLLLCSFQVEAPPPRETSAPTPHHHWGIRLGPFPILLGATFLSWASSAVMATYLSVYLRELGWSASLISSAFVVGVLVEILLFVCHPKLENRFSLVALFRFSMLLTVVRWLIMAVTVNPLLIFSAQGLHGFSFGGTYITGAKLTFTYLPDHKRDRGQGWYTFFGSGLGNLTGRIAVTYFAVGIESYEASIPGFFAVSGLVAGVGYLLSLALPKAKAGSKS